jgi:hypothetical protein
MTEAGLGWIRRIQDLCKLTAWVDNYIINDVDRPKAPKTLEEEHPKIHHW